MAKKELSSDAVLKETRFVSDVPSILYVGGIVVLGWIIYRSGYSSGIDVSRRVLRRHDKDERKMRKEAAKREKELRKELAPEKEKKGWWPW